MKISVNSDGNGREISLMRIVVKLGRVGGGRRLLLEKEEMRSIQYHLFCFVLIDDDGMVVCWEWGSRGDSPHWFVIDGRCVVLYCRCNVVVCVM